MFLWVQRLLRSALFVVLRITFYYSSWVNIKFNMMHQINVYSVFCFFSVLGFKDHLTLVLVLFRFLTVHVLRCRPRRRGSWTNFHVTPLEAATIFPAKDWDNYQSNTSVERNLVECVWKVFPPVGCRVESSCLLRRSEKRARGCVSKCLEKLDGEKMVNKAMWVWQRRFSRSLLALSLCYESFSFYVNTSTSSENSRHSNSLSFECGVDVSEIIHLRR